MTYRLTNFFLRKIMDLFDFTEFQRPANDVSARAIRLRTKVTTHNGLKIKKAAKLIERLPEPGEAIHIISDGSFDYFSMIPAVLDLAGEPAQRFYFSTWTMNRNNITQMVRLFDDGKLQEINALTGLYFATREKQVYAELLEQLNERKQRIFSNKNHSKITLFGFESARIVIEGSANFTSNPRIENFVLSNSEPLFDFHLEWMDALISDETNHRTK